VSRRRAAADRELTAFELNTLNELLG